MIAGASRRKGTFGVAVAVLLLTVAAGFGVYKLLSRNTPAIDTRHIGVRLLTDHGQALGFTSISADGRLVAYAKRESERSLRVKQVATGSEITVVPPQPGFFGTEATSSAATFTPDGNYLYYLHGDPKNGNSTNLYDVPALGGASRQIVSDVASTVAFSPDGKHMVYKRTIQDKGEDQLLVANVDGSGEKIIFRHESGTDGLTTDPSWSASSDLIAVGALQLGRRNTLASILVLTPEGKLVRSFAVPMLVSAVAWLPDSSGLFFVGAEKSTGLRPQIWFQPYPTGEPLKISNDLSVYFSLSVTADGKSLVTVQRREQATIYVGNSPNDLNDKVDFNLTPISTEQATGYNLSWTAAGKLLQVDSARHAFVTGANGANRVHLLENDPLVTEATACGSGDLVVLVMVTEDNAQQVWRINIATQELKQLSFGKADYGASCTPDGKWAVYMGSATTDKVAHIFKISIEGGGPVELAHGTVSGSKVSPDGTLVAYGKTNGQGAGAKSKFVIQKLEDGVTRTGDRITFDLQLGATRVDAGRARTDLCAQHHRKHAEPIHAAAGWRCAGTVDSLRF